MELALEEARLAAAAGDVPVGCVVVKDGGVVARAHNRREELRLATAHAEVLAVEAACNKMNSRRLCGCTVYVTLEPCPMCAGAILQACPDRLVFGAFDDETGAVRSRLELFESFSLPSPQVRGGVLEEECAGLLREFFEGLRA
ncbi:MAG: nucleoside deaminase [Clostridia bacterium]|nr:nucleoside deaminase [Clostridia bacterium]